MHITCQNLSKKYGSKLAVKDISLDIKPGQVLALLGPNGAGKSTTIKMLTGTLKPSSGKITIDNKEFSHLPFEIKSKLGIMPQEIIVWDDLNILENLEYSATIYNLSKAETKSRCQTLIKDLKLEPELKTLARNLSGGYKRRLNLAISIIHNPKVIFLDEPTPGIDAQSRILLTEYIQKLVTTNNQAVVLTDHYFEEAEKLADYVIIIDNGKIITEGSVVELKAKHGNQNLLQIHLNPSSQNNYNQVLNLFQKTFPKVSLAKDKLNISITEVGQNINKALELIESNNLKVLNLNIKQPSLEDIFLLLTGKDVRE